MILAEIVFSLVMIFAQLAGTPSRSIPAAYHRGTVIGESLSPEDDAWVDSIASALTLREKAAQVVVAWLEGGRPAEGSAERERALRLVREEGVGAMIVGNGAAAETAAWLNELQQASRIPLLVAADLEWGAGTRLKGATVLPINMALAAAGPAAYAREAGFITGVEARAAGVHVAFAPVADVNVNPDNPVINTRSYGSDPAAVSERVAAFIEGARAAGLLTVAKHFPGHGDTELDSHIALPVLRADRARLDRVELAPFRAAIAAGVAGVMTAHLAVPALDPAGGLRPATLSRPIITGVLRGELGFGGLVVTDALYMDAVTRQGSTGAVAVAAIQAGADLLLMPRGEARAIDAVVRAVRRGRLSEERLDESVRRVLRAKAAAGLRERRLVDPDALLPDEGSAARQAWSRHVTERSMTLVRGEAGSLPLSLKGRAVLLVVYDDRVRRDTGLELERALAGRGARVLTMRLSRTSDAGDLTRVRRLSGGADVVLFTSFVRAVPGKGGLGLPDPVGALADELAGAGAVVVSFGDPYLLRQLPHAGTYLLAWDREAASQEAAAAALSGAAPITGRLPIDLPGGYGVGTGLVLPGLPGITTVRQDH